MTIDAAVHEARNLWRSTAFAWGFTDCQMSCADFGLWVTGSDPARLWRGTYCTEEGARAVIAAAGGVVAMMGQGLGMIGAQSILGRSDPRCGDIVCAKFSDAEIGGLCLGRVTMFRRPTGTIEIPTRVLKLSGAWAL
jgi:hypothetical protein